MKRTAKHIVTQILGWQLRRLQKRHTIKVIGVVGSIGKTSTKFAIARVLSSQQSVRWQEGNYNDIVTVPLVFFGHDLPSLFNPFAWLGVFINNETQIAGHYPYDVVVVELGTDGPGQIAEFAQYLKLDVAVVTAITPEHMEFFKDLSMVAKEELSVSNFSDHLIINQDLCSSEYTKGLKNLTTFGTSKADVVIDSLTINKDEVRFKLREDKQNWLNLALDGVSKAEAYSATAAAIVAGRLGLGTEKIEKAIGTLQAVSGRMQRLKGVKDSLVIDETYNASPDAVIAALDSLYMMQGTQKIALLGNMNELGKFSAEAHKKVGEYCDPKQLDAVITLGPDANAHLAPAAEAAGCEVRQFVDPYRAGEYLKTIIKPGAIVLAKGSQNNVYAEEAVKLILADKSDSQKLVRQSPDWLKKKHKNFQT